MLCSYSLRMVESSTACIWAAVSSGLFTRKSNWFGSILSKKRAILSYACKRTGVVMFFDWNFSSSTLFFWSFSMKYLTMKKAATATIREGKTETRIIATVFILVI